MMWLGMFISYLGRMFVFWFCYLEWVGWMCCFFFCDYVCITRKLVDELLFWVICDLFVDVTLCGFSWV